MKNINLTIILLFLLVGRLFAQTETSNRSFIVRDFNHFFNTGLELIQQPFQFNSSDWLVTGATATGIGLSVLADKDIRDFSYRNISTFNNDIFSIDKYHGNLYTFVLSGGVYLTGLAISNEKVRRTGLKAVEAFIFSGAITGVTKVVLGRARPYMEKGNGFFTPFTFNNDYNSLPSGHTTVSFAVMTVFANSIDNFWWKTACYSTAGLVGMARIYHDQHWLSDVLLGAVIGYWVGDFVSHNDENSANLSKIQIKPAVGFNSIGLTLSF